MSAFSLWSAAQRTEVQTYVDLYPGLSDADMVTQLYTQRAVGFWPIPQSVAVSQQDQDRDQLLLDKFTDYSIVSSDTRIDMSVKVMNYIDAFNKAIDKINELSLDSEFWNLLTEIGFITAVRTTYTEYVTTEVLASDIASIRSM